MVLCVGAWWNFYLFSRTFPFIFHWKESRGNFTERTTNSIQFVVCKRSAFRPRYELSVTRLVAAQNKFQTETRIWCLSIRRPNNTDFGLFLFFFNSGPVCMTQSAALSSRVLFWVEKAKRFWQHCIPNRVESDLGSVGFSGPRLGCVLIAVEKLPPCALVLIRRCRRLSMLLLQCI